MYPYLGSVGRPNQVMSCTQVERVMSCQSATQTGRISVELFPTHRGTGSVWVE
ncbi:hypothetical protein TorRG33x02_305840, partial [Trema orientale]